MMLVAINSKWKLPFGYFFLDGLSAALKADLILSSVTKLNSENITVISISSDGPPVNLSTAQKLGVCLDPDNIISELSYLESDKSIVFMLDSVHNIKNVRNTFAAKKELKLSVPYSDNEKLIKWFYLEELVRYQQKWGLVLANKINISHIEFQNHKMKAALAIQIFSEKVCRAIEYCRDVLQLTEFSGSEATVEFLRMFGGVFDLLNSMNPNDTSSKAPIRASNKDSWMSLINKADSYIKSLYDVESNKRIVDGRNKTGKYLDLTLLAKPVRGGKGWLETHLNFGFLLF